MIPGRAEPEPGDAAPVPLRLSVSVTELVARRGPSLGALSFGGGERLWLGSARHAAYQAEAARLDPSFRAEVRLRGEWLGEGCRVQIHGRADGVRENDDGLVVEELKTVRNGPPSRGQDASDPGADACNEYLEACRDQAAFYAWMLSEQSGRPVAAELVWLDLAEEAAPVRERVTLTPDEVALRLAGSLAPYVAAARQAARERPRRLDAAAKLQFPHPTRRAGQEAIEAAVSGALEAREHLLLEAPTGLGKTVAALVPALRFALASDRQVVFLTAKTTQREGVLRALEALGLGTAAPGLALAAKRALCANDEVVCHESRCRFARDHFAKLARADGVGTLLARAPSHGPAALREFGTGLEVCPHALALEAAQRAVLVVGDYNHALSPGAALAPFARGGDASRVVLILDEVHNVAERARDLFGAEIAAAPLRAAAREAEFGGAPVHRELHEALTSLADWIDETVVEQCGGPGAARAEIDAEALAPRGRALERALARRLGYALATGGLGVEDTADQCGRSLQGFLRALDRASESDAVLAECSPDAERRLSAVCVDPAPQLSRIFARCHAVVGLSATLSPVEIHRERLGLDPARTASLALPSPFPRRNRRIVIDPSVGTRAAERAREAPRIATRLAAFAEALPGHGLALFPSFALLESVAARLPSTAVRVLVQTPGPDAAARERLVGALRERPRSAAERALVLAVAGGVLAEGVDYAGGGLAGIAVVGPCVPPPDPRRELLREAIEERGDDGFLHAYALPGMQRVVQAAGRLIRSPEDRGVVALLGRRFLTSPYRDALPADWCDGDPEAWVGDAAEAAREFFDGTP